MLKVKNVKNAKMLKVKNNKMLKVKNTEVTHILVIGKITAI